MIKAVIFDCFGVLTVDKWKEFVATLPEEHKEPARGFNHDYDAGRITEADFIEKVRQLTARDPGEVEQILVGDSNKNEELLSYIKQLRPRYKIGLLSNVASNWVRDYLLDEEDQNLFDAFIFSYEERTTKPDLKIYQAAADRLGVKPSECVFIDDTERYCEAARELGMQTIDYQDFAQMKQELEQILAR